MPLPVSIDDVFYDHKTYRGDIIITRGIFSPNNSFHQANSWEAGFLHPQPMQVKAKLS